MSATDESPLGKRAGYTDTYTPSLLHSIPRAESRNGRVPAGKLPFFGEDVWTAYEFSWLDTGGKPAVAGLRLRVPCTSSHIVESKSVKLYLNSYAQTRFAEPAEVQRTLESDLRLAVRAPVGVQVLPLAQLADLPGRLPGHCIDDLPLRVEHYRPQPDLLSVAASETVVHEALYSHLFRSICPVTGQPDWATMWIDYRGRAISREGLLAYLISFRRHAAFHEATVEQIFQELTQRCAPQQLSVMGLFLRRGGIDIVPFRSTVAEEATLSRLPRQ